MLPYMAIAAFVYGIARTVFLKLKKASVNWLREAVMFLFAVFLVGLASQTVIPKVEFGSNGFRIISDRIHRTNLIPFKVLIETGYEVFNRGNLNYFIINFLGNVILFIPIGFVVPLLWKTSGKRTVLIGFSTSFFIETCQIFLARGTDVDDLILNTAGVFMGFLLFRLLQKRHQGVLERFH